MDDWRLNGQEKYLKGRSFFFRSYFTYQDTWDHDHCEFCHKKLSLTEADALTMGYVTDDYYHWVCATCFEDFKGDFMFSLSDEPTDGP